MVFERESTVPCLLNRDAAGLGPDGCHVLLRATKAEPDARRLRELLSAEGQRKRNFTMHERNHKSVRERRALDESQKLGPADVLSRDFFPLALDGQRKTLT